MKSKVNKLVQRQAEIIRQKEMGFYVDTFTEKDFEVMKIENTRMNNYLEAIKKKCND